jgi:hypothetical protein
MFNVNSKNKMLVAAALMAISLGVTAENSYAQTVRRINDNGYLKTSVLPGSGFTVTVGQTYTMALPNQAYVQSLTVQAVGSSSSEGTIDVIANGEVKGTIHVPGTDPSYVVTIAAMVNSIEFRQTSGGGVRVIQILGTQRTFNEKKVAVAAQSIGGAYTDRVEGFYDALAALKGTLPVEDYVKYYQPVFVNLTDLRVNLRAGYGAYSKPVMEGWENMVLSLMATEPHLKALTLWPDYEALALDFRTMIAQIKRDLYN